MKININELIWQVIGGVCVHDNLRMAWWILIAFGAALMPHHY
jgi:hypothetical protein